MKPILQSVLWGMAVMWLLTFGSEASSIPDPSRTIDPHYLKQTPQADPPLIPDWQARWELARILSYVRKYPESIREYERLLSDHPDLWEAKREMVHVLQWSGQPDKALEVLESLTEEQRDDATKLLAADIYVMKKQYAQAVSIYRAYIDTHPEDGRIRARLADVYSWTGRYPLAIEQYQMAISRQPEDIQLRRRYALVLIWSKRYDDAIAELRKTLPP